MRVLVTGGCGFIGQELVEQLASRYGAYQVVVLDDRTPAATGWQRVRDMGVPIWRGKVQDAELVNNLFETEIPDVVIHCAAQSHVDASLNEPNLTWMANAIGTQVIAEACARTHTPLVYCSTDEVYGSTPLDSNGVPVAVSEDAPLDPSSPYSASKAAGEHAVRAMGYSAGLEYAITRGNNCFGPNQLGEKLVPIACSLLLSGSAVPLHGGGQQLRQWVHVSEFADALHRTASALFVGRITGLTLNIAGPRLCSVRDLVMALAAQIAVPPEEATWDSQDRPGQDSVYYCSGAAMQAALGGWVASRDILDPAELQLLLDHYEDNKGEALIANYVERLARSQK